MQYWDRWLVLALAVLALIFLIVKFRRGKCNCGSCGKECPARRPDSNEKTE